MPDNSVQTPMESHLGGPLRERAHIWVPRGLDGLELLNASFYKQNFNRHYHRRYAFGVIESGALGFHYLGRSHVAAPGEINLVTPGEVHDGRAAAENGWRYRMFYLEPDILIQASNELADRETAPPFFRQGVLIDPEAALLLRSLHIALEEESISLLEMESRLLGALTGLIKRHSETKIFQKPVGREPGPVERARQIIEDRFSDNISLPELAGETGLSRFHLLRAFKKTIGLPPHAYQTMIRVRKARQLMARGGSIAEAALESGFSDQSHLNRHFKRTYGVTPGQYRDAVSPICP